MVCGLCTLFENKARTFGFESVHCDYRLYTKLPDRHFRTFVGPRARHYVRWERGNGYCYGYYLRGLCRSYCGDPGYNQVSVFS